MKIIIASDHAGFTLKNTIAQHLQTAGHELIDMGTYSQDSCDYPVVAHKVCQTILADQNNPLGILICGTGIGMSITANRYAGIRAALCTSEFQARATREHNNANVLCLGERITGSGIALNIVDLFVNTPFAGGRHLRRLELIEEGLLSQDNQALLN